MKVVINKCYGGFSVSEAVYNELGVEWDGYGYLAGDWKDYDCGSDILRVDPELVAAVEKLGSAANGSYAELEIVDVPDDASWHIEEYDGIERIAEDHKTWG